MKTKFQKVLAISLIAIMLCSCATKEKDNFDSASNPFDASAQENMPPDSDNAKELYERYQTGGASVDFSKMDGKDTLEYNGSPIEITFSFDTSENEYDMTEGFVAFICGVPQMISADGGETSEMAKVTYEKKTTTETTLTVNPRITEDLKGQDELTLMIASLHSVDYVPQGKYAGYGFNNIHSSSPLCYYKLKINAQPEIINLDGKIEFENVNASDKSLENYNLKNAGEIGDDCMMKMYSVENQSPRLVLDGSKQSLDLVFNGMNADRFYVYLYVNMQRVKFDGSDYAVVNSKSGFVPKLTVTLDNLSSRDVIYAIAVSPDSESKFPAYTKTMSSLCFAPDDEILSAGSNSAGEQTEAVTTDISKPGDAPDNTSTAVSDNPIYKFKPLGYLDDDQNLLLMYIDNDFKVYGEDNGTYFTVYDVTAKEFISGKFLPYQQTFTVTYGQGCFTVIEGKASEDNRSLAECMAVTYNEKFEEIQRAHNMPMYSGGNQSIYSAYYCKDIDKYLCAYKEEISSSEYLTVLLNTDGSVYEVINTDSETSVYSFSVDDDKIILGRRYDDYRTKIQVMDFDGNIIDEKTMSAEYANLDVNRFGKYIAFLSLKRYGEDENPGLDSFAVLYDTETDKLMEFTPETADEAGCMGISPDGKIAVTMDYEEVDDDGIVTDQKQTLRYYDIESGKVIKTVNADDKPALNNFVVYDDGVIQTVPGYNKEKNERTETVVFFDRFDD